MKLTTRLLLIWPLLITFIFSGCSQGALKSERKIIDEHWSQILVKYQARSDLFSIVLEELDGNLKTDVNLIKSASNLNKEFSLTQRMTDIQTNTASMIKFMQDEKKLTEEFSLILLDLKKNNYYQESLLIDLSNEIYQADHEISKMKLKYASSVQKFNLLTQMFPNNIFKLFGVSHELPFTPLIKDQETTSMLIQQRPI
jgi:hypothetical protein